MQRMKKLGIVLGCLLLAAASVLAQQKSQKDAPEKGPPGGDEMAAMMAEMIKYGTPGEHHANLKPLAGKWKMSSKFRQVPEAPWNESGGESTIEWILGGRFLNQRVLSPATDAFPMDFEGFGLLGYDNFAKEYLAIWTDNFSTGLMHFKGSCNTSGKVITFAGEYNHPAKGGALTKERWVYRIINENKFVFEMWQPDKNGKEFMHGEITYNRVR